nr:hypothetical protein CcurKRNrm2_p066 [Cryptomonas curvata]
MSNLNEETQESEFFIVRRIFTYPIYKKRLTKFINSIFGPNYIIAHNLFMIKNTEKYSLFKFQFNNKLEYKYKTTVPKKEKTNKVFTLCLKNFKEQEKYFSEKKYQNLKVPTIRFELEWKFNKSDVVVFLKCLFYKYKLFLRLTLISLKIKNYRKSNFSQKIGFVIPVLKDNLHDFF